MDEAKLREIEERAKAATPGPWEWRTGAGWSGAIISDDKVGVCDFGSDEIEGWPPGAADAAFIAHAREDVPALVAEVRRMRKNDAVLRMLLQDARSNVATVAEGPVHDDDADHARALLVDIGAVLEGA